MKYTPFFTNENDPNYEEKVVASPDRLMDVVDKDSRTRTVISFWGEYDILPYLTFRGNWAGSFTNSDRNKYCPSYVRQGVTMKGLANHTSNNNKSYLAEYLLTFKKSFEKHNINAVLGYTWEDFTNISSRQQASNFSDDLLGVWGMHTASAFVVPEYHKAKNTLISGLGRLNYDYDSKYYLTISGRVDGSSKFGDNNKWAFFPSMALAWRVSNEEFLKDNATISNLKIRGSYGKSGSQAISPYESMAKINSGSSSNMGAITNGSIVSNLSAPNLTWETTTQIDAGIDVSFLNNRLRLSFDYYWKRTKDLLLKKQIPNSSGFGTLMTNFGEIENKGVELELGADIISAKNFDWSLDGNISFNKNKVITLGLPVDKLGYEQYYSPDLHTYSGIKSAGHVTRSGLSMAMFYGYVTNGLFRTEEDLKNALPGEAAYLGGIRRKDINNDNKITTEDQDVIGSPHPDFTFGITNSFRFKNLDLRFLITGSVGNDILNINKNNIGLMYSSNYNALSDVYFNSWSEENPNAKYASPDVRTLRDVPMDYFIEDGTYVRLKSLELGYRVPIKNRKVIKNVRVNFLVTNLFTITNYSGYDPEVDAFSNANLKPGVDYNSYPTSRTYSIGLNVTL